MSLDIEFEARFPKFKELKGKTKEDIELHRIIHGEDPEGVEIEFEVQYEYSPIVLNMDDIVLYFKYDNRHTALKVIGGDMFTIKCKFAIFKLFKESLDGRYVKKLSDFRFEEKLAIKAEEVNKILKEMPIPSSNGTGAPSHGIPNTFTDTDEPKQSEE